MNIWGCWGYQGSVQMHGHPNIWGCQDAPNIWGCQLNAPKCKSYMPLKKIRDVETYGGVGGIQMHGASKLIISYWLPLCEPFGVVVMKKLILDSLYFGRLWWS